MKGVCCHCYQHPDHYVYDCQHFFTCARLFASIPMRLRRRQHQQEEPEFSKSMIWQTTETLKLWSFCGRKHNDGQSSSFAKLQRGPAEWLSLLSISPCRSLICWSAARLHIYIYIYIYIYTYIHTYRERDVYVHIHTYNIPSGAGLRSPARRSRAALEGLGDQRHAHTMQCSILLYSTLLYSTLLYSTLLYSALLYSTLLYSTLLYSTLLYSTLLCSTLLYSALLYSTLLCSALLYSALLCSVI